MEPIQEKIYNLLNPINVILIVLELCFLMTIGLVLMDNLKIDDANPVIAVDDAMTVDGVPSGVWDNISTLLYSVASLNFNDKNVFASGAFVREESLTRNQFGNSNVDGYGFEAVSFIVDIPNLKQSYWVQYEQSDEYDEESPDSEWVVEPVVVCPLESEMIYESFDCKDGSDGLTRNYIVKGCLKYADFDGFVAYVDPEDEEMKHIRVMSKKYEYTDEESERYVRETKAFIESLGISPELFEYTVEPAPLGESDEPVYVY